MSQTFRTTVYPRSAEEAVAEARHACDAYFGEVPYALSIDVTALFVTAGVVKGYCAEVYARTIDEGAEA